MSVAGVAPGAAVAPPSPPAVLGGVVMLGGSLGAAVLVVVRGQRPRPVTNSPLGGHPASLVLLEILAA